MNHPPNHEIFSPAQAYWNQREALSRARDRIMDLSRAVDRPTDLVPYQFAQLMATALEFAPDFIIELGRCRGNSTCAFGEASNIQQGRIRILSLCNSEDWECQTVPRLQNVVPPSWFAPLEILRTDILEFNYAKAIAG